MPKLQLPAERMLILMDFIISNKINKIETKGAFFKSIGFASEASNLSRINNGSQAFKPAHYVKACEVYGVDGNFFLVKKHMKMMREDIKISPINRLKQAVAQVEMELKNK